MNINYLTPVELHTLAAMMEEISGDWSDKDAVKLQLQLIPWVHIVYHQ